MMDDDVKIVRLVSGEELIGKFDKDSKVISSPVIMIPTDKGVGFGRWIPYSEEREYQLKEAHIIVVCTPSTLILNEYNRAFGSGVLVPNTTIQ